MATKRMFDKAIVDMDKFMDMPLSAKALYFLLGMEADDEGFVSYKKVMRIHGGNDDDIKILIAKNLIIYFPSGVVVVTDWNKNNWLDSRRIKPTEYQKEKKLLGKTDNSYMLLSNGLASIEESSIEESSIEEIAETSSAEAFTLKEEIQKLEDHMRRDLQIIGLYLSHREPEIKTREQLGVVIKRHLRSAKELSVFEDNQIIRGFELAKKQTPEWTIETVVKMLTK